MFFYILNHYSFHRKYVYFIHRCAENFNSILVETRSARGTHWPPATKYPSPVWLPKSLPFDFQSVHQNGCFPSRLDHKC